MLIMTLYILLMFRMAFKLLLWHLAYGKSLTLRASTWDFVVGCGFFHFFWVLFFGFFYKFSFL